MGNSKEQSFLPLPTFQFSVKIPGVGTGTFQEVSGLDTETDIIEYRNADHPNFSFGRMPGLKRFGDVTLRRGMLRGEDALLKYFSNIEMNLIDRKAIAITLLNTDDSTALFVWSLENAYPIKITSTELSSSNNEIAVEELVFAHDGVKIEGTR